MKRKLLGIILIIVGVVSIFFISINPEKEANFTTNIAYSLRDNYSALQIAGMLFAILIVFFGIIIFCKRKKHHAFLIDTKLEDTNFHPHNSFNPLDSIWQNWNNKTS